MSNETFEVVENNEDGTVTIEDVNILTEAEAKDLTASIKSTATATGLLLKKAHDQKAWKALGYNSWTEYIENEFKFTRARSYQLLAQANVIAEISEAAETETFLTEKEAKMIKKELPTITQKIKEEVKDIEDEDERQDKTNEIVKSEIQRQMENDKDTYDESKDFDAMVEEDGGSAQRDNSVGSGSGLDNRDRLVDEDGPSEVEQANFYMENLQRTLSIMETFPKADVIANSSDLAEDEKIELRNRIKYAISWLENLRDSI